MKKKSRGMTLYIVSLTIVSLAIGGFYLIKAYRAQDRVAGGTTHSNAYYGIRNNATPYQKEVYEALTEALAATPRNDEKISVLVATNFVADFYTWTNKLRFNDVGGMQFISKDADWVYSQALDTFYNDMRYYKENNQLGKTLTVASSTATSNKSKHVVKEATETDDEVTQEGYDVHVTWTYEPSTILNIEEFQKESTFFVVKDQDGLYSILSMTGDSSREKNEY